MDLNSSISAVVTGGASGLGEATARMYAAKGVKVGIFDLDEARGQALANQLDGAFAKVDVSDLASVEAGFESVRDANGQERILVNCAGVGTPGKTISKGVPMESSFFEKVLKINLLGTFHCASRSALGMVAADPLTQDGERGVIINTASVAAFDGQIGQIAYSASKAGVVGMTLPMARDLSRDGVRVVTIAPGLFKTPMMAALPQEAQDSLGAQVPFPARLGHPSEFAQLATQIAENSMMNGETIRLDGSIRLGIR